jgi:hypothetical protein
MFLACTGLDRLAGPVQKDSDRSGVSLISMANDECESGHAYHALDCEIFLDRKVANQV